MAFDIKEFLNAESKKEIKDDFTIKRIQADKLVPSDKNFYEMDPAEIDSLKETIELVGVQENLVVKPIGNGKYEIISGHKRHRAVSELLAEGKDISNMLPCKVEDSADEVKNELILIFANSTQRERSDYCKMHEIQRVRELLEEYAKHNDLPGRKRDIIAGILNTSKTTIGRLDNIRRNIIPEFMEEYKSGNISTSAANEIAGASEEGQQQLLEKYKKTGIIHAKDAAEVKAPEENIKAPEEEEQLPGQYNIEDYPEYMPENNEHETENDARNDMDNEDNDTEDEIEDEIEDETEDETENDTACSSSDIAYWTKETAREIAGLSMYVTKEELNVLQNIAIKLKERAKR